MILIYIAAAMFVVGGLLLAFSLCRISGKFSREEERREEMETCPVCEGVCGIETAPNDWHDCDFCDATGKVPK